IYWRHEKSSANTLGNAFLEVHSIFEPEKEIILEARQQETLEETESGDPPRSSADEERTE
ncbi:MAG: hypothetical protein R3338_13165, partial [Thermoanaerobaculia bacterium]|nr:hypothetical protein [Thermoanaerobaculia bacterium]